MQGDPQDHQARMFSDENLPIARPRLSRAACIRLRTLLMQSRTRGSAVCRTAHEKRKDGLAAEKRVGSIAIKR